MSVQLSSSKRWKPSADKERKRLGSEEGWSHDASSSISSGSLLSRTRGKRVKVSLSPRVPRMLLPNMDSVSDSPETGDAATETRTTETSPPANDTTVAQPALHAKESQATAPDTKQQKSSTNEIWAKFSPGENGVYEAMAKGNAAVQRLSDQSVAKDALLAGYAPIDIQKAIAQNSTYAQTLEYPRDYARTIVKKAEVSPEVKEKRAQDEKRAAALRTRPSRKEAQKSQVKSSIKTRDKSRQKMKGRDRGMSY